jgi:hypothetical protein
VTSAPRHVRVLLQVPPQVEHPEKVDIAVALAILNCSELGEEIWTANHHGPDLQV